MTALIQSIEFALHPGGGEDMCLCIEWEPGLLEILRGLDSGDEVFEVTTDGPD